MCWNTFIFRLDRDSTSCWGKSNTLRTMADVSFFLEISRIFNLDKGERVMFGLSCPKVEVTFYVSFRLPLIILWQKWLLTVSVNTIYSYNSIGWPSFHCQTSEFPILSSSNIQFSCHPQSLRLTTLQSNFLTFLLSHLEIERRKSSARST